MNRVPTFIDIVAALWVPHVCRLNNHPSIAVSPSQALDAGLLATLSEGLSRTFHDAPTFDRLFQIYLGFPEPASAAEKSLPPELLRRIVNRGVEALLPDELVELTLTPAWLAEVADALRQRDSTTASDEGTGLPIARDAPLRSPAFFAAARWAARDVWSRANPEDIQDRQALLRAVARRLFGPDPLTPELAPEFWPAAAAAIRALSREQADELAGRQQGTWSMGRESTAVSRCPTPDAAIACDEAWWALCRTDPELAVVAELRVFADLTAPKIAAVLGMSLDRAVVTCDRVDELFAAFGPAG